MKTSISSYENSAIIMCHRATAPRYYLTKILTNRMRGAVQSYDATSARNRRALLGSVLRNVLHTCYASGYPLSRSKSVGRFGRTGTRGAVLEYEMPMPCLLYTSDAADDM
eukprot:3377877-Rhodomonas_salina.1